MAYLDKTKLVEYMLQKHLEIKNYPLSPIKLQKTLYYLYAMWGGNVRLLNEDINKDEEEVCEQDFELDEDLFEPAFEAWKYGPVDPDIYRLYKNGELIGKSNIEELVSNHPDMENQLLPFIDSVVEQTSDISDFTLVDMTHDDKCWEIAYKKGRGTAIMEKDSIIDEYAKKLYES